VLFFIFMSSWLTGEESALADCLAAIECLSESSCDLRK
jgi:hypothetical protein